MIPWWWDDRPLTGWRRGVAFVGGWAALIGMACWSIVAVIVVVGIIVVAVA